VQKVVEKETVQFYKRDRAGTGGSAKNEQVSLVVIMHRTLCAVESWPYAQCFKLALH
jgi:hypothetical protein